ncbi:MAG: membrane protein insertion efficiency factor YidD [Candidatus Poribacteria bacterium]|nr:membrane protein insertion efficiency factor YidD [Candidatus Poribacteria bacterium]
MVNCFVNRKIVPFCTVCLIVITLSTSSYAGEASDLAFILKVNPIIVNPIIKEIPQNVSHFNPLETSELKFAATGLIRLYQKFISSQDGPSCNFTPTCSHFGMACIQEFGMLRGILLTADRLIRCNGLESTHYHKDPSTGKYIDPVTDYDH